MKKPRLSIVSYSNTVPFRFGIENSTHIKEKCEISWDIPSVCADKLINDQVDIGLVPVAVLPKIKNYKIISDFCIATERQVQSVMLLSDVPIEKVKTIVLDYQSKTSVELIKILCAKHWMIEPSFINGSENYENSISGEKAGLIIGNRCLRYKEKFNYQYDLGDEWFNYTGLPFVFAVWVANKEIDHTFIHAFNEALKFGLNNIDLAIKKYPSKELSEKDLHNYLTNHISFELDINKHNSISKFLDLVRDTE